MSRATKRKHVTREVLEDFVVPTGEQRIVRVGKVNRYLTQIDVFLDMCNSECRTNCVARLGLVM